MNRRELAYLIAERGLVGVREDGERMILAALRAPDAEPLVEALRQAHDRLGAMIDQIGHPDYSLRELVDGLRKVRDQMYEAQINAAVPAAPSMPAGVTAQVDLLPVSSPATPASAGSPTAAAQEIATADSEIRPAPPPAVVSETHKYPDLGPFVSLVHEHQYEGIGCGHGNARSDFRCIHCYAEVGEEIVRRLRAVEKDAERYRWLRRRDSAIPYWLARYELDAAIDDAIAKEKP